MLRVVHISDTHNNHRQINDIEQYIDVNSYNILIHSGDFTNYGKEIEVKRFFNWLLELKKFDDIFFIAGNHELTFVNKPTWLLDLLDSLPKHIHYLQDELYSLKIEKFTNEIKIYGTPWQPTFYNWAFNVDRHIIKEKWDNIPNDTNILVTHGPPKNVLDLNNFHEAVGCDELRNKINMVNPLLNCFGHIHDSYGKSYIYDTLFTNASMVNYLEKINKKPFIIDINEIDYKFEIINL